MTRAESQPIYHPFILAQEGGTYLGIRPLRVKPASEEEEMLNPTQLSLFLEEENNL